MKHAVIAATAGLTLILFQSTAVAVDAEWAKAEAKEHGCLNCHNIDAKKKVGPGWADSAAKFKGKTAADLAAAVKAKPVHNSSMKKTSEKDLNLMSEWILTLGQK